MGTVVFDVDGCLLDSIDGIVAGYQHALTSVGVEPPSEAVLRSDVVLNHFASLPALLAASPDLIATVPDTIAIGWAQSWPLVVQPLPLEMHAVEVCLYRRTTTQQLGALDWLYDTVVRAVRGTHGEFFAIHGDARASA